MTDGPRTIVVTGFLGAGKSSLMAHLGRCLGGHAVVAAADQARAEAPGTAKVLLTEVPGHQGPAAACPTGSAPVAVVAVADAANVQACLSSAEIGRLAAAQLGAAALVVLTRTDLVRSEKARSAVAAVTAAEIVEAPHGQVPQEVAERLLALACAGAPAQVEPLAVAEWRYAGPAKLQADTVESMLANRPPGLYRLCGVALSGTGGIEVEVAGRVRQTRPVPAPAETSLVAVGLRPHFRPEAMALLFSEAVATSAHRSGIFGYR